MSEPDDEDRAYELARAFQEAWPAEIDDYLRRAGSARREAVVKLSNLDQELRWRRNREGRAADYFRRYPAEWDLSRADALALIAAEYKLRLKHLRLDVYREDYGDRYDGLTEYLRKQLPQGPPAPRYRDLQFEVRGGLGEIFSARDVQLGRSVAVKRIQARYKRDPRVRKQFLFEAEVTGRLEHPGILPVYSLDRGEPGEPEYAMPFIRDAWEATLRAAIKRLHDPAKSRDARARSRLSRDMLGRFVFIARTIAYAHDRGYLHRDINPKNILLGPFGETWVIDWGLAKYYKATPETSLVGSSAEIHDASCADLSRDDVLAKKFHPLGSGSVTNVLKAIGELRRVEKAASPAVRENSALLALKVANETRVRGSVEDSKNAYRLARDIYMELVHDFPKNEGAPKNLAACHQNLANLEMETGEADAARKSLLAGARLLEPIVKDNLSDHEARHKLAKIRLTMAILEKDRRNLTAASGEARSGLKLMEDLVNEEPENLDYLLHRAKGLSTLGNVLWTDDKFSEALEAQNTGLGIRRLLVKEDPSNREYQADLALSLYNIGVLKGQVLDAAVGKTQDRSKLLED